MENKNTLPQKKLQALNEYLRTEVQRIHDTLSPQIADQAINQIISAVSATLKMFTLPENAVNLCFHQNKIYPVPDTLKTQEACQIWIKQQQKTEPIRD
jgi:hypothetical protein